MTSADMKERTRKFALRVLRLVQSLPQDKITDVLGKQLLRCGTSVGANYRAACRARSTAEFISKLGIVEEEADECIYWMELLVDSGQIKKELVESLRDEASQILSIVISSIKTSKENRNLKSAIPNPNSNNPKSGIPNPKLI
jgi:four helix bundle protein